MKRDYDVTSLLICVSKTEDVQQSSLIGQFAYDHEADGRLIDGCGWQFDQKLEYETGRSYHWSISVCLEKRRNFKFDKIQASVNPIPLEESPFFSFLKKETTDGRVGVGFSIEGEAHWGMSMKSNKQG